MGRLTSRGLHAIRCNQGAQVQANRRQEVERSWMTSHPEVIALTRNTLLVQVPIIIIIGRLRSDEIWHLYGLRVSRPRGCP